MNRFSAHSDAVKALVFSNVALLLWPVPRQALGMHLAPSN